MVRIGADISDLSKGLNDAETGLNGFTSRLSGGMRTLGTRMTAGVSLPLAGIGALAANAAIDFESAMTGVAKTVDATDAQLAGLRATILGMATDQANPVAALENAPVTLAAIAENAGQLGVAVDDIALFTQTIGMMTMATNLSAEQAATMAAQFANIARMDLTTIGQYGASVVALGNAGASTESEIMAMGLRIAAAGSMAGMTTPDILGVASAMASLGLEAEAGGTAFSRVVNALVSAAAVDPERLAAFAGAAGMTADAFGRMIQNDPTAAIQAFVTGLGEMDAAGQLQTLQDLGMDDVRVSDALRRLAGDSTLLATQVDIANAAWKENAALTEEAGRRLDTTAAQIDVAQNNLSAVGIAIGDTMLPAINDVLSSLVPLLQQLSDLNPEVLRMGVIFGVAAIAIGPLVTALSLLVSPVGLVAAAIMILISAAGGLDGIASGLTALRDGLELAGRAITIIVDRVKRDIEMFFLDVELRVLSFITTFRQQILDATGGQVDIAPGINVDLNETQLRLSAMRMSSTLETMLREAMAEQEINVDEVRVVGDFSGSLRGMLSDETLISNLSATAKDSIEAALEMAVTSGDFVATEALLPVAMQLDPTIDVDALSARLDAAMRGEPLEIAPEVAVTPVIDPAQLQAQMLTTVTTALDTSMATAGEGAFQVPVPMQATFEDIAGMQEDIQAAIDQATVSAEGVPTFAAVVDLDTTLVLDVNNLHAQMQTAINEAAALDFHATLVLDMTLLPGVINVDAIRVAIAAQLAAIAPLSSGTAPAAAPRPYGMDVHAQGGIAGYTGPHWLEAGERVLTVGESRYHGGRGGDTYIINAYGASPYELAEMVARAERSRGGGA